MKNILLLLVASSFFLFSCKMEDKIDRKISVGPDSTGKTVEFTSYYYGDQCSKSKSVYYQGRSKTKVEISEVWSYKDQNELPFKGTRTIKVLSWDPRIKTRIKEYTVYHKYDYRLGNEIFYVDDGTNKFVLNSLSPKYIADFVYESSKYYDDSKYFFSLAYNNQ